MVFRPATPGFVVTLAATGCLAVVSFGVPLLKSIYFLSATIDHDGLKGTATFGTLGYCLQTGSSQACSNATVGWQFDPNALLSLDLPLNLEIPTVVVKWLTYVLVLHIVGFGLAAISAVFGLLAHIREMAMTCFSSCISGMAASVTLIAFIFDIVFFLVIRTRIRAVGGTANIGNALWLTLAAWVMLFFAGCFFGIGRCCFSSRPRGPKGEGNSKWSVFKGNHGPGATGGITHSEAMRLEAIKAEEDRKTRQAEVGLPAFPTNAEARPLKQKSEAQYYVEEDSEDEAKPYVPAGHGPGAAGAAGPQRRGSGSTTYTTNYAGRGRQQTSQQQQQPQYVGGYMQGAPGTRTIDAYNNNAAAPSFPNAPASGAYRQPSTHSNYQYASTSSPPPMPVAQGQQYLTPGAAVGEVYPGHGPKQSSYHSAVTHQVGASTFSQFDQPYNDPYQQQSGYNNQGYGQTNNGGYNQQSQQQQYYSSSQTPAPYNDPYGNTSAPYGGNQNAPFAGAAAYDASTRTYSPQQQQPQQQQQYGYGDQQGYGATRQPTLPQVNTGMAAGYNNPESRRSPTSPRGPRSAGAGHVNPPWSQQPQQQQDYNSGYQTPGNYDNGRDSGPLPPIPDNGSAPLPRLPANGNGSGPLPSIPQESPPGYELPPGAAPPGAWPKEKR